MKYDLDMFSSRQKYNSGVKCDPSKPLNFRNLLNGQCELLIVCSKERFDMIMCVNMEEGDDSELVL